MRTALIIVLAVFLLALSPAGLPRHDGPSYSEVPPCQSSRLKPPDIPGAPNAGQKANAEVTTLLGNLPLYFVENKGQLDNQVKYYTRAKNGTVHFTCGEIVYQFFISNQDKDSPLEKSFPTVRKISTGEDFAGEPSLLRRESIRVSFVGANKKARLEAQGEQEAKFSYFRGNDPQKWVSGARSYQKVVYRELYPGIDLLVSGREGRMKNEYVVKPGGDPTTIRVKYDGASALRVNGNGQLEIRTSEGMLIEDVPLSYQVIDGKKREVRTKYRIGADETVQFQVDGYRKDAELIIDPLTYSSFLGGWQDDVGEGIAVDGSGNVYVTGYAQSSDYPATAGAYDSSHNGFWDVFITKLNSSGSALLYSTFLGGVAYEEGLAIAIDGSGNAYVTGGTISGDFPTTTGAFDTSSNGGGDAFITKLNSSGNGLLYSTYLGGGVGGGSAPAIDGGNAIAVDGMGNAYITGITLCTDFPTTTGAYDSTLNSTDAFITKLDSTGSALLYSTYLGGSSSDMSYGIALDGSGNAYVTGKTGSGDFPTTTGAYDTSLSGTFDVFITKLNSSGSALPYSSFLGGSGEDGGYGIAVDASGNAYITGATASSDFPTTSGAFDTSFNGGASDVFVSWLASSGSALLCSTYLGGNDQEEGKGIALDGSGDVFVTGLTLSADFPTASSSYDTSFNGNHDAFVTKLDSTGSALHFYSTFLGGTGLDRGYAIATDGNGYAYVTGGSNISSDFPTTAGAYDPTYNGAWDAFVTKLLARYPDIRQPISPIDFGYVYVGNSSYKSITVYNDGDYPLTVSSVTPVSGSYDFSYANPIVPFSIPAGSFQVVTARFAPTTGGAKSAVFNVNSDDPDQPVVTFNASGTGVAITETVSTPTTPSGTLNGYANASYTYSTGGSVSNLGHVVQYLFDWGDGTDSGWLPVWLTSAQKSWPSANTYTVRSKARCANDIAVESSWSSSISVNIAAQAYDNSPSNYQVIPECLWAVATGGGTWVSEVQITDITGGSVVSVYFDYGGGNRRGPFTLWTSPGADQNVKYANILSSLDSLDAEAFTYYGRVGAVEFSTQDVSHKIQVTARTLNGNYSKTFPGLNLTDANTADTSRRMMIQNFVNNSTYRSTCGIFNPTADSVTLELKLIDANGSQIGSTITRTLVGYDFQSFSPFNQAGVPYPANSYDNMVLWVTPTSGSGKVMVFGASANNTSNDPAAHIGTQYQGTYDNAPSNYQVIPECIWAVATGGGTWVSEVQITDITGGSVVSVYFNYGAGNRRGPFTIWTSGGANHNIRFANILASIDAADADAFTYFGRVGAVEFSTQDASHKIQVLARTLNGNYSKTLPGMNLTDSNTANTWRRMMLQNFVNNATYRSNCGFFNPTADPVTVEFRLIDWMGDTIGSAFTRTLVGYDFQSFSPFNQAGVPYPANSFDNVVLWITPTSGSGKVMVYGATANNTSNDPAAHIGVQYQ